MTSGDLVEPVFQRLFKEAVEFHEIITEDVRIRSESLAVSLIYVLDDPFLILFPKIESMEWKSKIVSDFLRLFHVYECRAIFGIGDIVYHEPARHLMPRFTQKIGDDSRIHSARESYEDFGHWKF